MVVSMEQWHGRIALVTGASAGIGAAICKQLVQHGIKVIGLARRFDRLQELAETLKIVAKQGGVFVPYQCDVRKDADIVTAFKWTAKNHGRVAILINNAGISPEGDIIDGNYELWNEILQVNVLASCAAAREAVRHLSKDGIAADEKPPLGHIININSIQGHYVSDLPHVSLYPASKHAITAVNEVLANELRHAGLNNIRVTSICPGLVTTEMTTLKPDLSQDRLSCLKKFTFLEADDIADVVTFALSTPPHVQIKDLIIRPMGETL